MQLNQRLAAVHRSPRLTLTSRGFTLVELMIGLVVGLIVMAAVISIYVMVVRGSAMVTSTATLNQEMRTVINVMTDDIRRAGYWAGFQQDTDNPFMERVSAPITDIHILDFQGTRDCILYSYDATYQEDNEAGVPDQIGDDGSDFFGFRLNNGTVEMKFGGTTTSDCTADPNNWQALTDPSITTVTNLQFDTVGSGCMNVTADEAWQVAAISGTPGCEDTGGVAVMTDDGPTNGYVTPDTGDRLVELRVINIQLDAQHANDANLRAALSETVRVRNNRVFEF